MNQPFVTITRHAANQLFDTAVSAIWLIPQHTVRSLRTQLDSSYDDTKDHEEVNQVIRTLRKQIMYRFILVCIALSLVNMVCAVIGMGLGAIVWESVREGVYINVYSPSTLYQMMFSQLQSIYASKPLIQS